MKRFLLVLIAMLWLPVGPAAAHGVSPTADVQIAQTFAGNDLTVVLRRTPEVPGPLQVEIIAHDPVRPVELRLALAGRSADVKLVAPGPHRAVLAVASTGPHELELTAGDERALIPFRVLSDNLAGWEVITYGGFTLAGFLIITSLATAVLGVRRPVARALAVPQAVAVVVVVVVATTTAVLSKDLPPAVPDGATPTAVVDPADGSAPNGRPYLNLGLSTVPAAVRTGGAYDLQLKLYDGNTGRPADDLVAHHAALVHAVVTSQSGKYFRHVHPVRTGPGVYTLRLTAYEPGLHRLHAEFERADSGAQLVTGSFDVTGTAVPQQKPAALDIKLSPQKPVAGRPVTIQADVRADDLQPWLGMAGHLILRDQSSDHFGHVHELTSMTRQTTSTPDETVADQGPVLRFTYTFPKPGTYLAWVQFARDFRIYTHQFTITVAKGQP